MFKHFIEGILNRQTLSARLQALAAAVLFGASAPLSKLLLGEVEPIPLAALLYLGSGLGAGILFLVQRSLFKGRSQETHLTRADRPWLLGAILAGGVAAPILLLWGLAQTPASTASLLLNFEGVATALIAALVFKEAVGRRILWAMGLITLASILLSWTGGAWGISVGALGVLGACILWGLDNNFTRNICANNPLVIVGIKGLGAGLFSGVLALLLGKPFPGWQVSLLAMAVGSVSYGVSIQLFILAMRGLGAARTSMLFGMAPFVGTFLSVVFLREVPQALFWVAVPVMLGGAWLMLTENHTHDHLHESVEHAHPHSHPDEHHTHPRSPEVPLASGTHTHPHHHERLVHTHVHTPDLHHWHKHRAATE